MNCKHCKTKIEEGSLFVRSVPSAGQHLVMFHAKCNKPIADNPGNNNDEPNVYREDGWFFYK